MFRAENHFITRNKKGVGWGRDNSPDVLAGEWVHKVWCAYEVKHHSAIRRNTLLIHTGTQVNRKTIWWSERIQTQRQHTVWWG